MSKLVLVVCLGALVGVFAEPPSSYLPPQARNQPAGNYGAPSQQQGGFGGRSSGGSFSYNSLAENQFGGSSRSSSRARPSSRQQQPQQQYGAPGSDDSVVTNAARFGPSRQSSFGAPAPRQSGASFGAPRQSAAPSFGAPRQSAAPSFGAPRQAPRNFGAQPQQPSFRQQSAPQFTGATFRQPSNQYSAPSSQYSAPSSYARQQPEQPAAQYGAPSTEYGAPFGKKAMDDDLAEPANYEYNYEVQAGDENGAEFGHQETREDDFAQGEYHVLLPDGRMQIVEYEADEEGFRPKIRYEDVGTGYPDARDNQGPY